MSVKTNIDKKAIINELNRRETEKTVSFEYAYEKGKRFINNLGK
ncbi:MAG: hypothetical protein Q8K30_03010 [Candidatus Gracilibacteria bacterium]|nr:hypothetical protein [Candidatus Gracilibacteria bacterium]